MKLLKKLFLLICLLSLCVVLSSCSKMDNSSGGGEKATGANEYISSDYGFSFKYNNLKLDSKIDGDQFAELTHLSGDKAIVKIHEPDKIYGNNPEEWLMKSFETSEYNVHNRKLLKLGNYNARLVEYSWKVGGKPIRTIDLTAYKDGLFYNLIVTMKEENVNNVRGEFDVLVNSFALSDKTVDLQALKPWRTQLPADYPVDVIDLYGIEKIHAVIGDKFEPGKGFISVHYYVKDKYTAEDISKMFQDSLKDSQNFKVSDSSSATKIEGIKSGYNYKIEINKSSKGKISLVKVEVRKQA